MVIHFELVELKKHNPFNYVSQSLYDVGLLIFSHVNVRHDVVP